MRCAICNLVIVLAVLGCADRKAAEAPAAKLIETPGPASVRGRVKFGGKAPEPAKIDNSICRHAGPIVDESVLVSPGGGLANVIVSIAGVRSPVKANAEPAVLDQKDCRFEPHIVVVRAGQPLRIRNSDAEAHNVHATPSENSAFNIALAMARGVAELTLARPEIIRVKCDVHPWMTGFIGVFESDYVAVSDNDGSFEIKGLPPGSYELVAWHERFGELKQTVTVTDGAKEANFAYQPPQ